MILFCPRPGSEATDNARVWRVYRDRVNDMDADTISGWNDTINFLLVFVCLFRSLACSLRANILQAGLFSAVMTAFLIELCVVKLVIRHSHAHISAYISARKALNPTFKCTLRKPSECLLPTPVA